MLVQAAECGSTSAGLCLLCSILIDRFTVGQLSMHFSTQTGKRDSSAFILYPPALWYYAFEAAADTSASSGVQFSCGTLRLSVPFYQKTFSFVCVVNHWPEMTDFPRACNNVPSIKVPVTQYFDLFMLSGVMSASPNASLTASCLLLLLLFT